MSDEKDKLKARVDAEHAVAAVPEEAETTFTKNFSFSGHGDGSNVARVDVKKGSIVRIRPLHYDEQYQHCPRVGCGQAGNINLKGEGYHQTGRHHTTPERHGKAASFLRFVLTRRVGNVWYQTTRSTIDLDRCDSDEKLPNICMIAL